MAISALAPAILVGTTVMADQVETFTDFAVERCLPAMAQGRVPRTDDLRRLDDEATRSIIEDSPGAIFASETPNVLMWDVGAETCAILAERIDSLAIDASVHSWLGADPFRLSERFEEGGVLFEEYVWTREGPTIRVVYSRPSAGEAALLTISREAR